MKDTAVALPVLVKTEYHGTLLVTIYVFTVMIGEEMLERSKTTENTPKKDANVAMEAVRTGNNAMTAAEPRAPYRVESACDSRSLLALVVYEQGQGLGPEGAKSRIISKTIKGAISGSRSGSRNRSENESGNGNGNANKTANKTESAKENENEKENGKEKENESGSESENENEKANANVNVSENVIVTGTVPATVIGTATMTARKDERKAASKSGSMDVHRDLVGGMRVWKTRRMR